MAEELKPSTFYTVYGEPQLDQSKQDALLYLYQPIIGNAALSLYLTLMSDITLEGKSPGLMHTDLLAAVDTGLMNLVKAREQLEGIGLLEAYEKTDSEIGLSLIYQLRLPLGPKKFFQDPLMAYLLMDKVGKRRYERLVERFKPNSFEKGTAKSITKRFRDVYRFDETTFASHSEALEQTQEEFADKSDFDWSLFTQQLRKYNIALSSEEKKNVVTFQQLYGVNPIDMAQYIAKATVGEKNGLDYNYLQKLLDREKRPVIKGTVEDPSLNIVSNPKSDFGERERELINQSKSISPVTFLRSIKAAKNGFETDNEVKIVKDLVNRNIFPTSVINILIHYILVVKENEVIHKNFFDSIASSWAQKKITTPEEAILSFRENKNKLVPKTQSKRTNFQQRNSGQRRELPEYIKNPPKPEKVSAEKEAEIKRRMAEFMKKEGDD